MIFFWTTKIISQDPLSLKLPLKADKDSKFSIYYPSGAVNYIKEHALSGNLLTEFSWGEYLIWTLYPQCRVSLDGRYEQVYPEIIYKEYGDFIFGRGNWKNFLDKYPPDIILIPFQSKLSSLIQNEPHWQKIFADSCSILFVKKTVKQLNNQIK